MPITILDYVKSKAGEKDSYPAADFFAAGVDILGGCEICAATIAAYNAYPSKSGYWRCGDCIRHRIRHRAGIRSQPPQRQPARLRRGHRVTEVNATDDHADGVFGSNAASAEPGGLREHRAITAGSQIQLGHPPLAQRPAIYTAA